MNIFTLMGTIMIDDQEAQQSLHNIDQSGEQAQDRLTGIVSAAGKVAVGLAAAGAAALTALGVKAVGAAADLSNAMNDLQNKTGATDEEMADLHDTALEIYNANLGEDFNDIAAAMANVKQVTGETGEELKNSTKNALLLRDTFEYEVNESINAANSLMRSFGISSDQAYTIIAQGAQQGADKNGDLIDTLNEYAPQFAALGFSADQFASTLVSGAANGAFSIDKVGDAVKEFNIRAKDMSDTTNDAFESLGLDATKMGAAFAAGGQSAQTAFTTVITKLQGIKDPLEQNRVGVDLFGTQFEDLQGTALSTLGNIQTTVDSTAGTLDKINEVKFDTFGGALEGIKRGLTTGVLVPIGEKVLPILTKFAQWIQDHMPEIRDTVEKVMDVAIEWFDKLTDAVGFVIDKSNIFLPILSGLAAAIGALIVINTIVKAINLWKTATTAITAAQVALNIAMNLNPIGIVITAIGALVAAGVLLYQNWDKVKEVAGDLWDSMRSTFGKIKDWVLGVFDDIKEKATTVINWVKDKVDWVTGKIDSVKNLASNVGSSISNKVSSWVDKIPGFAVGTDSAPGGLAIVGEQGPELVNLPRGSQVISHGESMAMLGGGYKSANIYFEIDGKTIVRAIGQPLADEVRKRTGLK